jgi:hypothetical protein
MADLLSENKASFCLQIAVNRARPTVGAQPDAPGLAAG